MEVSEFIALVESAVTDLFPYSMARSKKSGKLYHIVTVFLGKAEGFTVTDGVGNGLRGWISLDLLEPTDEQGNRLMTPEEIWNQ